MIADFAVQGAQMLVVLLLAPLLTGLVRKIKARLLRRAGPPVIQPYRDLVRLMRKEVVLADTGALLRLPEELHAVDSDLADTVQRLVGKAEISAMNNPDEAISKRKLLETWYDLWERWNSHVCEVGDEEGDYVIKDADWEPPYFDPTALADDLEKSQRK